MRLSPLVTGFVAVISLLAPLGTAAAPTSPMERARDQFCAFYLGQHGRPTRNLALKDTNEPPPNVRRAAAYVRTLRPDGSWPDIDYASHARSGWPPATHWTRLLAIVAAGRSGGAASDRPAWSVAVHRAFAFWIRHDFQCPNWWYNQIGVPKMAATTALLMGDQLTSTERQYLTGTMMPRAKIGMTGQNRVWLAGNTLMLGLLESNEPLVAEAAATIWSEVGVRTSEGIQPDFSFHQHGPQQQFGNYGLSLAVEIGRWGTVLRGTPWAMPTDRLAAYRGFLLDGEAWVVWRGWMDVSACDRQLMPGSQTAKQRTLAQVMRNAEAFDPGAAAAYRAFLRRNRGPAAPNDLVGDRVYWRSDYVIHRRPGFAATLKLSSRRVIGAEVVNLENLRGYHLADGALYLYRRGDEYADIFPVWDWQKIPGVTCAQLPGGPPPYQHIRGTRDFVGGVTDGVNGCAALDYARDGVDARKAWFFGRDAIVCLGADIRSTGTAPVVTTVNQCRLRGPVLVKRAGAKPAALAGGERVLSGVEWVEHDGWRYTFLAPTTVHLATGPRTGNWARVFRNPDTPRADVTEQVFSLWLDHRAGAPRSYAYVITPAATAGAAAPTPSRPVRSQTMPSRREKTDRAPATFPLVEANTPPRQVVQLEPGVSAAVFWSAGGQRLDATLRVTVDAPCVVIADQKAQRLFVADPTQRLTELNVTVNGVGRRVMLPQGGEAGRSVQVGYAGVR